MIDRLKAVHKATVSRIIRLRASCDQLAKDARQGFNVDDTEVKRKLQAIESFYLNTFGEAYNG